MQSDKKYSLDDSQKDHFYNNLVSVANKVWESKVFLRVGDFSRPVESIPEDYEDQCEG